MNVVAAWRGRSALLRGQAQRCVRCGALFLVRRRACVRCAGADFAEAALPRTGRVTALARDGLRFEQLDQWSERRASVLLALDTCTIACLVAEADADHLEQLRDAKLSLRVRRLPGPAHDAAPLAYGMRASASIATRLRLGAVGPQSPSQEKKR